MSGTKHAGFADIKCDAWRSIRVVWKAEIAGQSTRLSCAATLAEEKASEHRPSMRGTGEYVKQSVPLLLRILLFFNDAVSLALATCCKNRESLSGSYAMANQSISTVTTKCPNIGLVLEGGGALGLAHIGVIQWLEEHRIPVSYVAGTSMGGLVGGWYATGRSDAEVRQVVQTINWDEVLRAQTLFPDLAFRRKEDASSSARFA